MDKFSLNDMARFFATPILILALLFWLGIVTLPTQLKDIYQLNPLIIVLCLVSGPYIYNIYRSFFYLLFMSACDLFRPQNYRNLFKRRYTLSRLPYWNTVQADGIFKTFMRTVDHHEHLKLQSSNIHMCFQYFLISIPFLAFQFWSHKYSFDGNIFDWKLFTLFVFSASSFFAGIILNNDVEYAETREIKLRLPKCDKVACELGFPRRLPTKA